MPANGSNTAPVRIWDLPTRLFHWLIVAFLGFSWWSGKTDHLEWHVWSGYAVLGLLAFRLVWGFLGSPTARFGHFVRGPRTVRQYLREGLFRHPPAAGHNPVGGWSVIALLSLTAITGALGLFAVDTDGLVSGPLSLYVDYDTGRLLAHLHNLFFNLLFGLVVVHIAAIIFYAVVGRENLIGAMITGRKRLAAEGEPHRAAGLWRWALAIVIAGAVAYALMRAG